MLGDLRALATDDGLLVLCERVALQALFDQVRRGLIGWQAELHKRTLELGLLSLVGPRAEEVARAAGLPIPGEEEHDVAGDGEHRTSCAPTAGSTSCRRPRAPPRCAPRCWPRARSRRRRRSPRSSASSTAARATASTSTRRVMPAEAGIVERAVSFTKGCYVGQETVARLHWKGKPNRHLRGLELSAPVAPGAAVTVAGDDGAAGARGRPRRLGRRVARRGPDRAGDPAPRGRPGRSRCSSASTPSRRRSSRRRWSDAAAPTVGAGRSVRPKRAPRANRRSRAAGRRARPLSRCRARVRRRWRAPRREACPGPSMRRSVPRLAGSVADLAQVRSPNALEHLPTRTTEPRRPCVHVSTDRRRLSRPASRSQRARGEALDARSRHRRRQRRAPATGGAASHVVAIRSAPTSSGVAQAVAPRPSPPAQRALRPRPDVGRVAQRRPVGHPPADEPQRVEARDLRMRRQHEPRPRVRRRHRAAEALEQLGQPRPPAPQPARPLEALLAPPPRASRRRRARSSARPPSPSPVNSASASSSRRR